MSTQPTATVMPFGKTTANARRAQRGHLPARTSARASLDARVAQLELAVMALDRRLARGAFNRTFQVALAGSILLHLLVISLVTFTWPERHTDNNAKPLEVVLVNAKSKTRPVKALAQAQHNLDGGGNTDADRRAKSPLPLLRHEAGSGTVALAQKRVEQLEQEVRQLMAQRQSTFAVNAATTQPVQQVPAQPDVPPSVTQADKLRALNIQRLEAEIAQNWELYQKRPRRRSIGAATREYQFARYVDDWRIRVERLGETHYPQAARDQKLYGSLLLTVSIRANGALDHIQIRRSSGSKILDDAALRIVRLGAPYAPFPAHIAKDTDVIDISRTWRFTSSDRIETE